MTVYWQINSATFEDAAENEERLLSEWQLRQLAVTAGELDLDDNSCEIVIYVTAAKIPVRQATSMKLSLLWLYPCLTQTETGQNK